MAQKVKRNRKEYIDEVQSKNDNMLIRLMDSNKAKLADPGQQYGRYKAGTTLLGW